MARKVKKAMGNRAISPKATRCLVIYLGLGVKVLTLMVCLLNVVVLESTDCFIIYQMPAARLTVFCC